MKPVRYALWRIQALFDTRRIVRIYAVRDWWSR